MHPSYWLRQLFNARIACPTGFGLDRSFYRSELKSQCELRKFEVRCNDTYFFLLSPKGRNFALLDTRASKALGVLQDVRRLRFEAIILPSPVDNQSTQMKIQELNEVCNISINIYGTHDSARQVGGLLTQAGLYLQHPFLLDYGLEYSNPHYFVVPGSTIDFNRFVRNRQPGSRFQQVLSMEVTKLLDSLDSVETDYELPPMAAIQTPLLRSVPSRHASHQACSSF